VLDLRSRLLAKCSPATVNKVIGIVKVLFRDALYREEINPDPTAGVGKIKERKRERGIFTGENIRAVMGWMEEAVQNNYTHMHLDHLKVWAYIIDEIWRE
jgi:hypothetical protein